MASEAPSPVQVTRPRDTVTTPRRRAAFLAAGLWNDHTLPGRVAEHARRDPGSLAVVDQRGERRRTYADLDRDANRIANALIAAGIGPGDVVSVQMPNWYETVVIDVGVLRAGAVMNPALPNYREKELRHMLGVGGVKVFFCPDRYRRFDHRGLAERLVDGLELLEQAVAVEDPAGGQAGFWSWLAQFPGTPPDRVVDPEAVSELIFTSGTEAQPKAIMHTEQTTNFSARAVSSSLGVGAGDVVWMASPIGHSTGFNYGVRVALYHGLPLVLQDQWSAEDAVALIEEFRCSYSIVATTFVSDVCELAATRECDLSSMRLFGSGGAPIPPEIVGAARQHGMNVLRLYGSTELLMVTTNRPGDAIEKLVDTDGRPLDHVELQIRDEENHVVVGEPGEILVRGPNTCVGFYNDPARTADTFDDDGWVRSGDLGIVDADGFMAIVGRKKEIIIRGGLNIAPREIEDLVITHPAVAEAAVVGLPHARLGEMTCACVVLRPGADLDLDALVAFLKEKGMATFKLPQRLEVIDSLPRTLTGKVRKFELVNELKLHGRDQE
jgi:acyl-coenzyme A synthetase/AMP-(fatty) acid ligase